MTRIDRYIFLQLMAPFGFFTLALAGILWLGQTLPLISLIIDNGKSGFIFLEFSVLILPSVLALVMPVSAFIATLYAVNKLFSDSEMVVFMSAGLSPLRIARPVAYYGLFIMTSMYIIVLLLVPVSSTKLGDRVEAIKRDAINSLLREKQFIHPMGGITIYIRESSKEGEISGLFLNDQREPLTPVTYSAKEAILLRNGDDARLAMSQGLMQQYNSEDNTLNTIGFDKLVFELPGLLKRAATRYRLPVEYTISELSDPEALIASGENHSIGTLIAEFHNKLAQPLLSLVLPLIAAAFLLSAQYRRSGFAVRIAVVSFLGLFVVTLSLMVKNWIAKDTGLFWVAYAPAVLSMAVAMFLLLRATRGPRPAIARLRTGTANGGTAA